MSKFDHITLVIETLPDARAQVQVNIPTPMPGMRLETAAHALAIDALGWLGKQPAVAGFVYSPDWPASLQATQHEWLQKHDLADLERFAETSDDGQSYDIGKEAVKRLADFGCIQSHGFGQYSLTAFGRYVLNEWRELPFRTNTDRDAEQRAALAVQARQGGAA